MYLIGLNSVCRVCYYLFFLSFVGVVHLFLWFFFSSFADEYILCLYWMILNRKNIFHVIFQLFTLILLFCCLKWFIWQIQCCFCCRLNCFYTYFTLLFRNILMFCNEYFSIFGLSLQRIFKMKKQINFKKYTVHGTIVFMYLFIFFCIHSFFNVVFYFKMNEFPIVHTRPNAVCMMSSLPSDRLRLNSFSLFFTITMIIITIGSLSFST